MAFDAFTEECYYGSNLIGILAADMRLCVNLLAVACQAKQRRMELAAVTTNGEGTTNNDDDGKES